MKISTSILSSKTRVDTIKKLNNTTTDYIHFDMMDNIFVPNQAFSIEEIKEYANVCYKKIDAHFMVEDPIYYLERLNHIKFNIFTFHIEVDNVDKIIKELKKYKYKIGLAIKPNTDINLLDKYLDDIDLILVMSVEPGFGGQKFIDKTPNRIKEIKKKINNRNILIEVDGGINNDTIKLVDVDIAVAGSYIINNKNYQQQIDKLKTEEN